MSFPPPEKSIFTELASDNLLKMEDGLMKLMSEQKEVPFYDMVIKLHMDEIKSLRTRNAELEAEVGRLREVLGQAQWLPHPTIGNICPVCMHPEEYGHMSQCPIKQALSQKAGERYKKMQAVVESAKSFINCPEVICGNKCLHDCDADSCAYDDLVDTLINMEGGGGE